MARDDDEFKFSDDDEYSLDDQMSNMASQGENSAKEGKTDSTSSFENSDFDNTEFDGEQGDDPFAEDDPFADSYPISEPSFFNQHKMKIIIGVSVVVLALGVVMLKDTLFPQATPPAKKPATVVDNSQKDNKPASDNTPVTPAEPVATAKDLKSLQNVVTKNEESIKTINDR